MSHHMTQQCVSLHVINSIRSVMRGVSKQNTIKRARLKLIKIFTFQNKAFASKRPKVRDRRLLTKSKLKGGQKQNRAQKDPIKNIASSANSIDPKVPRSHMLIEHRTSHLDPKVPRSHMLIEHRTSHLN
jgi:hypothetical protein